MNAKDFLISEGYGFGRNLPIDKVEELFIKFGVKGAGAFLASKGYGPGRYLPIDRVEELLTQYTSSPLRRTSTQSSVESRTTNIGTGPLINGVSYLWRDVTLMLFGVPVIGITEITYSGKRINNSGFGNIEYSGSITLFLDEWKNIISAAPNSDPKQIPFFDIQVVYGISRASASTDVLQACEFMEDKITLKQRDGKFLVHVPLIIGGITNK